MRDTKRCAPRAAPFAHSKSRSVRSVRSVQFSYALRGLATSIGVAEWETLLTANLPKELKGSLPTVKEIETELARGEDRK